MGGPCTGPRSWGEGLEEDRTLPYGLWGPQSHPRCVLMVQLRPHRGLSGFYGTASPGKCGSVASLARPERWGPWIQGAPPGLTPLQAGCGSHSSRGHSSARRRVCVLPEPWGSQ